MNYSQVGVYLILIRKQKAMQLNLNAICSNKTNGMAVRVLHLAT